MKTPGEITTTNYFFHEHWKIKALIARELEGQHCVKPYYKEVRWYVSTNFQFMTHKHDLPYIIIW